LIGKAQGTAGRCDFFTRFSRGNDFETRAVKSNIPFVDGEALGDGQSGRMVLRCTFPYELHLSNPVDSGNATYSLYFFLAMVRGKIETPLA